MRKTKGLLFVLLITWGIALIPLFLGPVLWCLELIDLSTMSVTRHYMKTKYVTFCCVNGIYSNSLPLVPVYFAGYVQKKQSKGTKRKTRQAKALEARKAPRTFLELLHEVIKH